jgi:hypothetical protein
MWRRERVGRTSTPMEAGAEKERVHGVDSAAVEEAVKRGVEADAEEE